MGQILLDSSPSSQNYEVQDKIVGYVGAILVLILAFFLLCRLLFGKSKPRIDPELDKGVRRCACGYYLVPSDIACPQCHADAPPTGASLTLVDSQMPPAILVSGLGSRTRH